MTRFTLTRELAFAAGQDVGNRSMRDASRKRWSAADADKATETTNRLLLYVPFDQGGLEGLELTPSQRADLLISDATWQRARAFLSQETRRDALPTVVEHAAVPRAARGRHHPQQSITADAA